MSLSIYDASVPVYQRRLAALSPILDKAAAYAADRKIEPLTLIRARLYPDMLPLWRQVQLACGQATRGAARLSGTEPARIEAGSDTFEDLKDWITRATDILGGIGAEAMQGAEDRDIIFPSGDKTRTMKGSDYLLHFSLPHFYFHVTTTYAILRHNGLDIGKADYMADA